MASAGARSCEGAIALVLLVALAELPPQRDVPYIVFPVLLWSALRFGPRGASTAILVVCSITVWNTAHNAGPFVRESTTDSLLATQLFIAIAALTSLVLAAVTAERTRVAAALAESEAAQRALADEQAALRRVATLVAGGAPPSRVFEQVTEEVARLLGMPGASLMRYDGARTATVVGGWSEDGKLSLPVSSTFDLDGDTVVAKVLRSGEPQRVERYADARGRPGRDAAALGLPRGGRGARHRGRASCGARWPRGRGRTSHCRRASSSDCATSPSWSRSGWRTPTPTSSSPRRARGSSRSAMPSAGGSSATCTTARSNGSSPLALDLRMVGATLEKDPPAARKTLAAAQDQLAKGLEELRELARGIHPAVLTERGLGPALQGLLARAPVPVEITEMPEERLAGPVEAAAYYVVAEAITNVAKYAQASYVTVSIRRSNGSATVVVTDDGIGGANPAARHRPARAGRPDRGARRPPRGRQPDRARHPHQRRDTHPVTRTCVATTRSPRRARSAPRSSRRVARPAAPRRRSPG